MAFHSTLARTLGLSQDEVRLFSKLTTPAKIQDYLETLYFNFEYDGDTVMSPRRVIQNKKAHCFEGALFAACALSLHGYKPLILDLRSNKHDFDHVIAVFKMNGHWGAISKTNHAVLRYRDPIYKTIRELVYSYFHEYFLDSGRKTLVDFSGPFDLLNHTDMSWVTSGDELWDIPTMLDESPHTAFLPKGMTPRHLRPADPIERQAGQIVSWKKK